MRVSIDNFSLLPPRIKIESKTLEGFEAFFFWVFMRVLLVRFLVNEAHSARLELQRNNETFMTCSKLLIYD